jgi:glycosyltransferase involved in cell wall biosynthesis
VLIAIDARELCGRPTGVGRYLACLLKAWDTLPEAAPHRFVLYTPAGVLSEQLVAALGLRHLQTEHRVVPSSWGKPPCLPASGAADSGTWWEQVHLARALRRDRPDVLFAPAYTAPLVPGVPVVLTIHDVSFLAHPEWFPARTRWRQRILTTLCARRARHVLTDSEFSRGEIVARLGLALPAQGAKPSDRSRERMVLFVGSVFNRRHLPELIQAVAAVSGRHPGVRLEIVGDNRTFPHQDLGAISTSAGFAHGTTVRSYVSDDVLADLYARAGLFVFLSDYEGFGLTPLEALSRGVPILVGDTPVAREVYGEAGTYVGTTDQPGIVAGIERLLFDEAARTTVLSRAVDVLERYSWERAGRHTLAALLDAPSRRLS